MWSKRGGLKAEHSSRVWSCHHPPRGSSSRKSRGKTTLNWVITWELKWLQLLQGHTGPRQVNSLFWCCFQCPPGEAACKTPRNEALVRSTQGGLTKHNGACFRVADGGAEALCTHGTISQSSGFGGMAGLPPRPWSPPVQKEAMAPLCRATSRGGGGTEQQAPRRLHPLGTQMGITPLPQGPFPLCLHPQPQAWVLAREPRRPSVFNLLRVRQVRRNSEESSTEVPLPLATTPSMAQGSAPGWGEQVAPAPRPQSNVDCWGHQTAVTREAPPPQEGRGHPLAWWEQGRGGCGSGRWESLPLGTTGSLVHITCLILPCTSSATPSAAPAALERAILGALFLLLSLKLMLFLGS